MANPRFHLITVNNCTIKVYILPTYRSVATKLTKAPRFELGLSSIW